LSEPRYFVLPKARQDLASQAIYFSTEVGSDLGHRFLVSAHETFLLLSTQPEMGWKSKLRNADLKELRIFRVSGFERILVFYRPRESGLQILRVLHGSQNVQRLLRQQGIE
jgi:toxin ParE1/3/4